jgi:hypothetical protein
MEDGVKQDGIARRIDDKHHLAATATHFPGPAEWTGGHARHWNADVTTGDEGV